MWDRRTGRWWPICRSPCFTRPERPFCLGSLGPSTIGACSVWPLPFPWPRSSSLTGSFPKALGKAIPFLYRLLYDRSSKLFLVLVVPHHINQSHHTRYSIVQLPAKLRHVQFHLKRCPAFGSSEREKQVKIVDPLLRVATFILSFFFFLNGAQCDVCWITDEIVSFLRQFFFFFIEMLTWNAFSWQLVAVPRANWPGHFDIEDFRSHQQKTGGRERLQEAQGDWLITFYLRLIGSANKGAHLL